MKIQKYHLLLIIMVLLLTSCGLTKKKKCNDCPDFSKELINTDKVSDAYIKRIDVEYGI